MTRKTTWCSLVAVGLLLATTPGCEEGSNRSNRRDGGTSNNHSRDGGDIPEDGGAGGAWSTEVVGTGDVGSFSSIDIAADGTVGVAYFAFNPREDGICEEVTGDPPPRTRYALHLSLRSAGEGEGGWESEVVTEPLHLTSPVGVSFRFTPEGVPALGLFGGEPVGFFCSANDLLYGTRNPAGEWSFDTAVADSGDTAVPPEATCSAEAANAGNVVGEWPVLAFDSVGRPALAFRDTHWGGSLQRDDIMRADAEMVYRSDGWQTMMVDCGDGGGHSNALVFDSEDRPVVAHRIPRESQTESRHGLWVHRQESGGSWLKLRLASGQVDFHESSLIAGPQGTVALVYFDPTSGHPWVAELEDTVRFADGASWRQTELGNNVFIEGQYPSIARSPSGILAVAYYRCTRAGRDTEDCDPDDDALIFAWRTDADVWRYETVDQGGPAQCGTHLSLGFGPDGSAWISYACARQTSDSAFTMELKVAHRRAL